MIHKTIRRKPFSQRLLFLVLMIGLAACQHNQSSPPSTGTLSPRVAATIQPTTPGQPLPASTATPAATPTGENGPLATPVPLVESQAVTFTAADDVTLNGSVYGSGTTAVIFATMSDQRQESWTAVAQEAASQGYLALTFNFRFWRENNTIDPALRDRAADDLAAAIAFVREQGAAHVVLIGASLGGLAAIKVADESNPAAVVVMAAPMEFTMFPSLQVDSGDIQAITASKLFINSENDGAGFTEDTRQMFEVALAPKEIEIYPGSAHGTELLATEYGPAVTERIMTFIETYAPAGADAVTMAAGDAAATTETAQLVLGPWHDMVYDERQQMVVLVNGGPERGHPADAPVELWRWDSAGWTALSSNGPPWRNFATIAYDIRRQVLVLYGGLQSNAVQFEDTWEWDGEQWTQHNAPGPGFREGAGMAYDEARGHIVLFGGAQNGVMKNDTWTWDGQSWTQVATDGPSARFPGGFTYDAARQVVLLFGGHAVDSSAGSFETFGDTWTWDGTAWRPSAAGGPSPRDGARAVYDRQTKQVLLFGGASVDSSVEFLADTWIWDGAKWTELALAGPPGRVHHALAYDPGRGRIVLAGGSNGPGPSLLADVWEWDGHQWTCAAGCS